MMQPFLRIRMALSLPRLAPHLGLLLSSRQDHAIRADMRRWAEVWHLKEPRTSLDYAVLLVRLMTFAKEFRNVFYMRFGIRAKLFAWLCPSLSTLEIHSTNIGPGLFIQHGISTLISAHCIGKNCWINQQVTIGFSNDTDAPTIGDNVRVFAGAKIIGKVRVGDNVTVGANSVVLANVPANATVIGVSAQVVWRAKAPKAATA